MFSFVKVTMVIWSWSWCLLTETTRAETEVGNRDCCDRPDYVASGKQFLGVLIRKTVEFFMQDLRGHHSRSMQDRAVGNLNCGDLVQEVSEEEYQ